MYERFEILVVIGPLMFVSMGPASLVTSFAALLVGMYLPHKYAVWAFTALVLVCWEWVRHVKGNEVLAMGYALVPVVIVVCLMLVYSVGRFARLTRSFYIARRPIVEK